MGRKRKEVIWTPEQHAAFERKHHDLLIKNAGWVSHLEGFSVAANPYSFDSPNYDTWRNGWFGAEQMRLEAQGNHYNIRIQVKETGEWI